MDFNLSLKSLKGIGDKRAKLFQNLGIKTLEDLIWHFPREYDDRRRISYLRDAIDDINYNFKVIVLSAYKPAYKSKGSYTTINVSDGSNACKLLFINAPYAANDFIVGEEYFVSGKVKRQGSMMSMFHPDYVKATKMPDGFSILPIYNLTAGLSQNDIRRAVAELGERIFEYKENLPDFVIGKRSLLNVAEAIYYLHFPAKIDRLDIAKKTLIYDELFNMQMAIECMKLKIQGDIKSLKYNDTKFDEISSLFEFELTSGQKSAIEAIIEDMDSNISMNRLLQGDVGSGKTAVSIAAAYKACASGYQAAIMAPTEILASQHYKAFSKVLGDKFKISLLTSSQKSKSEILDGIKSGECNIIIGTHAILSDKVVFNNLALVITDEQHRFGVNQRRIISKKASGLDVLVMSATPIPRTLSLILFGDMSISEIRELPKNRIPISTHYIVKNKVLAMYEFIKGRIKEGERAFFVAPTIEESEVLKLKSVTKLYEELKPYFEEYGIEMLHSQIPNAEKNEIMARFSRGETSVIVSTTVIEVGIDVKEATIMVITHSERFGLAQLHQLRGRVGRGDKKSYCFLLADKLGEISRKRIQTMVDTNDGFEIAKKDLEIRGPGEFIGDRQHGLINFKLADLNRDLYLIEDVRDDVMRYIKLMEQDKGKLDDYIEWLNLRLVL